MSSDVKTVFAWALLPGASFQLFLEGRGHKFALFFNAKTFVDTKAALAQILLAWMIQTS